MWALNKQIANKLNTAKVKGFIMVELIVVLIIIVLLLVTLLPLITGYIDDAKKDAEISEARSVKVAMQTMINESYADDKNDDEFIELIEIENYGLTDKGKKQIENLLRTEIGRMEKIIINENTMLTGFTYFTVNGSKIVYDSDNFKVHYIY